MTITLQNAKDLYLTANTFSTPIHGENALTAQEKEDIRKAYKTMSLDYEKEDVLYFIAIDYDTFVINIKKVVTEM